LVFVSLLFDATRCDFADDDMRTGVRGTGKSIEVNR
jgi:hypothetical protein